MKRRVFKGELCCAIQNIGTKFEKWWIAGEVTPFGRLFSFRQDYSCRIQDAIPLKYTPYLSSLFEDESDAENLLLALTSEDDGRRLEANTYLLEIFLKHKVSSDWNRKSKCKL